MTIEDNPRIRALKSQLNDVRRELLTALAEEAAAEVADYTLHNASGPVKLSALFGDKQDLFVVHNMGTSCPNCTMWSDGFNGLYPHIRTRAAYVVCGPDEPDVQVAFAVSRGWKFPLVSHAGTTFASDMGFVGGQGEFIPGISVFQKRGDRIFRVSATAYKPDDLHGSAIWHLFALLPDGARGWTPNS